MKPWRIALVTLLTLGMLALWLRSVDLREMGRHLATARPGFVLLAALASLAHVAVRSWRWRVLLAGDTGTARQADLFRFTLLGYALSFVVPGRAGELLRPVLLWRRGGVPFGRALGSVLLERILDVAVLGTLLAGFMLAEPERTPASLRTGVVVLLGAGIGALTALALLARRHRPLADRLIAAACRKLPARVATPAGGFAASLLDGMDGAFRARRAPLVIFLSLLTWTPVVLTSLAGFAAARVDVPMTAALALVPLTALGIAVPTPAGVGGYHAAATWGLGHLFGVPSDVAAACAVATHAASVLPIIAAGLYASWAEGLSLAALRREAEPAGPETPTS